MHTWNHRVIQKKVKRGFIEQYYEVHEVHYNADGDIVTMTESAVVPYGETIEELKESLGMMLKACEHPILVEEAMVYHDV